LKKETLTGNLEKIKNILKELDENKPEKMNYLNELGNNGFNAIHMAVLSGQEDLLDFFYEK